MLVFFLVKLLTIKLVVVVVVFLIFNLLSTYQLFDLLFLIIFIIIKLLIIFFVSFHYITPCRFQTTNNDCESNKYDDRFQNFKKRLKADKNLIWC